MRTRMREVVIGLTRLTQIVNIDSAQRNVDYLAASCDSCGTVAMR